MEGTTSRGITDSQQESLPTIISIDGSYGEGGGQILRNSCAYAALLFDRHQVLHIKNIRSKRTRPGLQRQHLISIEMLADLVSSTINVDNTGNCHDSNEASLCPILHGGYVGSQQIWFGWRASEVAQGLRDNNDGDDVNSETQNKRQRCNTISEENKTRLQQQTLEGRRQFVGDTETAGSICLLLQAVLPFALLHRGTSRIDKVEGIELVFRGGTNATLAPPYDYFEHIFLPTLKERCKVDDQCIRAQVVRRGFYPKGGGEVRVTVRPCQSVLQPIVMKERGEVININIRSFCGGKCPKSVAVSMATAAESYLKERYYSLPQSGSLTDSTIIVEEYRDDNILGSGSGILIVATTSKGCRLAGSAVGSFNISPKTSGRQAAAELVDCLLESFQTSNADIIYPCVDKHLQDQLILYMALAEGVSEVVCGPLSLHTQTAIWLAEKIFFSTNDTDRADGDEKTQKDNPPTTLFEVIRLDGKYEDRIRPDKEGRIPGLHLIRCRGIGFGK
jgi:RNA 3'-terminal phosphate cyclase (ATP)